jgi:catechol 2,3-dioxygenase-like lactoylglutathione lyase family enzyme
LIPAKRLGHVTFETPDIDQQIDHYTKVVGLNVAAREKDRAILATHLGEEVVVLERGQRERTTALSLQIDAAFDMAQGLKELRDSGIATETRSDITGGIRSAIGFQDPNGTRVELFSETGLVPQSERTAIAPIKIGHVAFVVRDAQQMVDFYTRVLGFRVSDWAGDFFAFLRCGPDHHTVNFMRGEEPRMHHFAFELKDWAHIQHACDHLGQKNVKIIWGPGRHGIGHNIFVYHFDPDHRVVEFYTELDQMKDEELGYFEPRPWHKDRPQRPKVWTDFEAARVTWGLQPSPEYRQAHAKRNATPASGEARG